MTTQPATLPSDQPARALLMACGNTLRGDDGVGWRIGRAVEQRPPCDRLTVVLARQLLPEHAEAISAADVVVFVDCSAAAVAGTVSAIALRPAKRLPHMLSHPLNPAALLKLAADLYARMPAHAILVTVGGESFALTDQLSRTVRSAVPKALEAVRGALVGAAAMPSLTGAS